MGGTWGYVMLWFFIKLLHPRLSTQWWYLPALIFRIMFAKRYFFPTVIGQYFPVRKTLCFSFVMDSFIYLFISVCRVMDSHHWVIIYQCFYFDTLNIPVLVSGSPLKVMPVSFWHASINRLSISLLVAQDVLGWLFLHISRVGHFFRELW